MMVLAFLKRKSFVLDLLLGIFMFTLGLYAHALSPAGQGSSGCAEINKEYPFPDLPSKSTGGRITRAELLLGGATQIAISERSVAPDDDNYDSEIVLKNREKKQAYEVPRLIKGGRGLRLLRARVVCGEAGRTTLILGFESGWTDARQAFVVMSLSGDTFNAFGTKVLYQGKLVLDKARPDHFQLWSASYKDAGLCGACAKHYVVYDCEGNRGASTCNQRPHLAGPLEPNEITGELIEVR
jgi:hypothetical protein